MTFEGVGLRPYRPVHLRARTIGAGDLEISWIRRTRQGGDGWGAVEVPLAEANEQYLLRILKAGGVLRSVVLDAPVWQYGAAAQALDGVEGGFTIEVAQISELFGPGPFATLEIMA